MRQFEIVENTTLQPFDKHWQFCVGSGHAGLALRADYCRLLKLVREELGMERVRFHGIFGDAMHTMHTMADILPLLPGRKNYAETSFRLSGVVYDNILAAGMKPFVELGFMPNALAKSKRKGLFYYKPNINPPKDYGAWKQYIQSFVRFLRERYGEEEVRSWYFEVWNEPDLRIAFFNGSQSDYFRLYEVTAKAIKELDPQIPVGGPATSNSKWVAEFMKFCKDNQVPVDFVSTHQYAGDPLGGVKDESSPVSQEEDEKKKESPSLGLSLGKILHPFAGAPTDSILPALRKFMGDPLEEKDTPDNVFQSNAPIVKRQAEGLPVYYTEWNTSATFSAYSNDTRKVAAYDIKTSLALEGIVDGSSIWCFSDIFEEFHPFPEEFHGGFGLLTQSGIKKPVYHGMKMLADAGKERYDLPGALDGEISLAAFRSETETQLLLTRQKLKNLFDLPKEEATVTLALGAEPQRVYLQRIDEEHCNPLKTWEELGSPQVPSPSQLAQIQEQSAMREEELPYTYQDGKLSVTVSLGVNDVYFICVVRG